MGTPSINGEKKQQAMFVQQSDDPWILVTRLQAMKDEETEVTITFNDKDYVSWFKVYAGLGCRWCTNRFQLEVGGGQ